jgi:sugar/nucleoside kinase (ribokinase family)
VADAIVAGHLCLDIIPELHHGAKLEPGRLIEAGSATLSTGGAVSNVGRALLKLGIATHLIGMVGDDMFGKAVLDLLGPAGKTIVVCPSETTSYTIVLNVPGQDRMFLHAPGCNRTFTSSAVSDDQLRGARLIHFGYPPLMESMYASDGEELVDLFRRAKRAGATTSLDLSLPDADSESGKVDWKRVLERVLPICDLFCPSLDELQFMLGRHRGPTDVASLAREVLQLGARVALIKLGAEGVYLSAGRELEGLGRAFDSSSTTSWRGIEIHQACFPVQLVGTTGSGDATIAGFLMAILQGMGPRDALRAACAVGACSVEAADAISGVKDWPTIRERLDREWR